MGRLPQDDPEPAVREGAGLVRADAVGTAAFVLSATAAAVFLRPTVQAPAVVVAGGLFVGGCAAFGWGFLAAVRRSRTETIELSSLFFLKESAPAPVRRALLVLLAVQVVTAIVTASVRPFTSLAFGVLAPVWGLGLVTLWAGRYGRFPATRGSARTEPPAARSAPVAAPIDDDRPE